MCLVDPVGDVYACPFAIHDEFLAGKSSGCDGGGFESVWRTSDLFERPSATADRGACTSCSAFDACQGGCMAAKFFTGLPLDGPDPECVRGNAELALAGVGAKPQPDKNHSRSAPARRTAALGIPTRSRTTTPDRACDDQPARRAHLIQGLTLMASTRDWFESVAEAQRRAKKRVPKAVYLALLAGSEAGATLDDNAAAFGELGLASARR